MSELSASAGSEGYGACDDDGARGAAPCTERSDAVAGTFGSSGVASQSAHAFAHGRVHISAPLRDSNWFFESNKYLPYGKLSIPISSY